MYVYCKYMNNSSKKRNRRSRGQLVAVKKYPGLYRHSKTGIFHTRKGKISRSWRTTSLIEALHQHNQLVASLLNTANNGSKEPQTLRDALMLYRKTVENDPKIVEGTVTYKKELIDAIERYGGIYLDLPCSKFDGKKAVELVKDLRFYEVTRTDGSVQKEPYSATRIRGIYSVLKHTFAGTDLPTNPMLAKDNAGNLLIELPSAATEPRYVPTRKQFEAFFEAIKNQKTGAAETERIVRFLMYTGCRKEEGRAVRWDQVDLENELIEVDGGGHRYVMVDGVPLLKDGKPVIQVGTKGRLKGKKLYRTKNKEKRHVPIGPELRNLLEEIRSARSPGESTPKSRVISDTDIRDNVKRACRLAGIKTEEGDDVDLTIHDLRHAFSTFFMEATNDAATAAKILGHLDGGKLLMENYNHTQKSHMKDQMRKVRFL